MAKQRVQKPKIKIMAADWSLRDYPSARQPWSVQTKVRRVKEAGFAGMAAGADAELAATLHANGLEMVGGVDVGKKRKPMKRSKHLPISAWCISMCSCAITIRAQKTR